MINPFIDFNPYLQNGEVIKQMYDIPNLVSVYPFYFITNAGRIFSTSNWRNAGLRELTPSYSKDDNPYLQIRLIGPYGAKHYRVNRLVLYYFGESIPENVINLEANHKDHNHLNNWIWNLNWLTHAENMEDCGRQGLMGSSITTEVAKLIINDLNEGVPTPDIAKKYSVSEHNVLSIKYGRSFKYVEPDNRKWVIREDLSNTDIMNIYMALKQGIATKQDLAEKYNKSIETIDAIRRCQYPYNITLRGFKPIIENNTKCKDEIALAIYNELKAGDLSTNAIARKYGVGKSLVADIKFLRNAYTRLRKEYNIEPLDAKTNNIRCTEELAVEIYKDIRDNHLMLQDVVAKYHIGETTANDIKLCRGGYSFLRMRYGFRPIEGKA